jgi:hypothetical protein
LRRLLGSDEPSFDIRSANERLSNKQERVEVGRDRCYMMKIIDEAEIMSTKANPGVCVCGEKDGISLVSDC